MSAPSGRSSPNAVTPLQGVMQLAGALLRGRSGFAAAAQTGFATALMLGANVATGILSARVLGADGRGELQALLLAPQAFGFLFTLGLPAALIVTAKNRPESESTLMGAALLLSAAAGAVAVAVSYFALPPLMGQYDAHTIAIARALVITVFFGVPAGVLLVGLQIRDRFIAFNRLRYWQSGLVLLALAALAVGGATQTLWWALAYLLPATPFFLWNAWWVGREFKPSLRDVPRRARELLAYGLPIYAVDALGTLLAQVDKLVLIAALAPSLFGVYVVVFNLSRLVTTFATAAVPVLLPRTAGKSAAEIQTSMARALSATTLLSVCGLAAFAVAGAPLLRLVYGADFAGGYWTLVILCVEATFASAATILQQPYVVLRRAGTIAGFQVVSLLVGAIAIYFLARSFAAEGAAVGVLMATSVRLALIYAGYRALPGMAAPRLVPAWDDCLALMSRLRTPSTLA